MSTTVKGEKRVVFFHPDLGIGGAERLVVDAAVSLQNRGHKVTIFTSHCDPTHCFDEARDGTLDVRVRGNTLVPPSILSRLTIICAILRQLHLILTITLFTSELKDLQPDVFFIDQLSAGIPLLRLLSPARILFYCHFPDKLLAARESTLKKLYRVPFDWLESWTTGASDVIVVNSEFTRHIFGEAFPTLKDRVPAVVYPCVDTTEAEDASTQAQEKRPSLWKGKKVLLSINRFERKKDVGLAIRAFAGLDPSVRQNTILVIAGGYDPRMTENVTYHTELEHLAAELDLKHATAKNLVTAMAIPADIAVLFLLSVPSSLKTALLESATLLIYTPRYEHFGIVPLEAMLARVPVLAANTGGPRETVVDGQTGFLRNTAKPGEWTEVMGTVLREESAARAKAMGLRGRERAVQEFSKAKLGERCEKEFELILNNRDRPPVFGREIVLGLAVVFGAVVGLVLGIMYAV